MTRLPVVREPFPVRNQAFTMVEIAIAVLILVMGLLPLYQTFINSSRDAKKNRNRSYAAAMAASVLERYRAVAEWGSDTPLAKLEAAGFKGAAEIRKFAEKPSQFAQEWAKKDSEPAFLDDDPLLSPWKAPAGTGAASGGRDSMKDYNELVEGRYRRLAFYDRVDPPGGPAGRMGRLGCTVLWTEEGSLPGISAGPSGLGTVRASYTLAVLVTDPLFPAGRMP